MGYNIDRENPKMTLDQIKQELNGVIFDMKEAIAEEEKSEIKTSNYLIYKMRLAEAQALNNNILKHKKDADTFLLSCFEQELFRLQLPIL